MPVARSSRRKLRQFPPAESILGPLPLFEGEDGHACEELLKRLRAAIPQPNPFVDIFVRDIDYHTVSIARYQRYEAEFSKKLDDSEKRYKADRQSELEITIQRMRDVQQLIDNAQRLRIKAFKQIEFISTTFATALRKAMAEAEAQWSQTNPENSTSKRSA